MAGKPSYLGLLNAISNAEGRAQLFFEAWAKLTQDDELRAVLKRVAVREGEHALSFEKRMMEMGYSKLERPDPQDDETHRILADPAVSDLDKLRHLGYGVGGPRASAEGDIFGTFFADPTIDIETGTLLGRYIAEERDSGRRLRAQCRRLEAAAGIAAAEAA